MHENVLSATVRRAEAEPLFLIEKLDCAVRH